MNKMIKDYLKSMINEFSCGNDNEYEKGEIVEFRFEEIEKGDIDLYDEEEVVKFYEVRKYINEMKEVNYKENEFEYIFKVEDNDIICRFVEL
jgi:hypothetical protein